MPTVLPNPNRPLCGYEADFTIGPPNLVGSSRKSLNSPTRRTIVRSWSTTRGRQYELDQVQAGEATLTIVDPLEYLNSQNTGSPFNTSGNTIKPYRPLRIWAIWPTADATLRNIINPSVDSSYDSSFTGSGGLWSATDGTATLALSNTQAHTGAQSLKTTQFAAGVGRGCKNSWRTAPGITYTFSAWVWPAAATTVVLRITDASGATYTATSTTPSAWQRLSVTWTTVDTLEKVEFYSTAGTQYWVDDTQLEFGAAASTYTANGPTLYMIYNGYVERYPLAYDMNGTRHISPLTATDALANLSRTEIVQTYLATILADNPTAVIPYTEPGPPHLGLRPNGGSVPIGYAHLGLNGSVNYRGDTFLDGTSVLTVVTQNADPAISGDPQYITLAGTRAGTVSMSTNGFTLELWLKFQSGTIYLGAAATQAGENLNTEATGASKYLGWAVLSGQLAFKYDDPNGGSTGGTVVTPAGSEYRGWPDEEWRYYAIILDGAGNIQSIVDTLTRTRTLGFTPSASVGFDNMFVQATTYFADPASKGAVAYLAMYPTALSPTQQAAHYQRGIGYLGEVSGARVSRLLSQYWAGASSVAPGVAKLAPDYEYNRRNMLDVLQEIQETERGLVYVDRAGTVVFEDRASRYTNQVALWVFGENPAGASPVEYPYIAYAGDFDPTYTFSQTNLTRPGNSNYPPEVNATAQTDYGQRILTQTLQVNSDFELAQAGLYYRTRYANPKVRVTTLTLNPVANPALWPVVLSLEISQRVTVKRRSAALTTSNDFYIEQINHQADADAGTWTVDLQLSPVFLPTVWILGDSTYGVLGSTTVCAY